MNDRKKSPEEIRDICLEYLKSKYEDTFTAKGFFAKKWANEYSAITFSSAKYPDEIVEVRAYGLGGDECRCKDNYFKCFMRDEAMNYFSDIDKDLPGRIIVRFPGSVWSDELAGISSFVQWVSSGKCLIDVFVILDQMITEERMIEYTKEVIKGNISGMVSFIVLKNNESIGMDLDGILNNQGELVESKRDFCLLNYDSKMAILGR